ncbi:aromatic ring-hydroxylating dioxygenase subunit alpha [Flexivirga caeni]|uniref:Aromatic ring-hydroxylating dioxygenase subunit alpha n=1 Tax=Flexivirga caeni TaxID=2294115 RepID=A0A3M9MIS1_9MICO|nr:aromatic ring-hydroxylating dioxygenase subunit alpha [Flexivirga caeni]RNI25480.1 aromatic ring-hydroxylating dioxygenase subunit alpha [Flexivirga caeni]
MFIKNAWYVVAWSEEVTREPLARTVLGEEVMLYRTQDGKPVALADRCAHRAYPLSAGRVIGDNIQCGYHGFEYDCSGICVKVPAQERIPQRAVVTSYPVHEAHRWVWIFMGDAEKANSTPVPDNHWMTDPAWDRVTHTRLIESSAELIHDNLLDLTHESFLHESSIGDDSVFENGVTVEASPGRISVDRWMPHCHPSPLFEKATGLQVVDRWHTTDFQLPSLHTIHAGVVEPGGDRADGHLLEVLNAITPQTESTSWYFYGFCRNFNVGDQDLNDLLSTSLGQVLDEDANALALQQTRMEKRPQSAPDVLIGQDAGVAKARRLLAQLLKAESEPAGADDSASREPQRAS